MQSVPRLRQAISGNRLPESGCHVITKRLRLVKQQFCDRLRYSGPLAPALRDSLGLHTVREVTSIKPSSRFLALTMLILSGACTATPSQPAPAPSPTTPPSSTSALPEEPSPAPTLPEATAPSQLATLPGEVFAPYPTFNHITLEWMIMGDDNLNGIVSIRFRDSHTTEWRQGMPLRRVPAGYNDRVGFGWMNKHSGSLFDLAPATTYEIELALSDPDGGSTTRSLTVATRTLPAPMHDAPVIGVTPDTLTASLAAARPGDILELGPGTYGDIVVQRDGEPGRPIVIRSAGDAKIQGEIDLDRRRHIILEGLTIAGTVHFHDGESIAVMRCRITTADSGIVFQGHARNAYVADNVVIGPTLWRKEALGVNGDNLGEGIQFSGPGHVIEHNTVVGFRDNISFMEQDEAVDQFSIDVLGNEIGEAADDGVEADYCFHNCRIIGNRLTNVFMGVSSQPGLGGPTYFIRNVMYNVVYSPFKLHNGSVGDVALHNTVVKSGDAVGVYADEYFQRAYFRNNLFLGGPGGFYNGYSSGPGLVASLGTAGEGLDFDYNAYGTRADRFLGQLGTRLFTSLEDLRRKTSEKHAVLSRWDDFAAPVAYPGDPFPALPVADLRLRSGATAQDAALRIPNINDNFEGAEPDIGAYEGSQPLPLYGPRVTLPP